MPLVSALLGGLLTICGSMVGRVMIAMGLSYVTYKGFDVGVGWLLTQIKANMSAMPADVLSFLGWLWVDKAISMVFSAYSVALTLKMGGGASFTKMITKKS